MADTATEPRATFYPITTDLAALPQREARAVIVTTIPPDWALPARYLRDGDVFVFAEGHVVHAKTITSQADLVLVTVAGLDIPLTLAAHTRYQLVSAPRWGVYPCMLCWEKTRFQTDLAKNPDHIENLICTDCDAAAGAVVRRG